MSVPRSGEGLAVTNDDKWLDRKTFKEGQDEYLAQDIQERIVQAIGG